MHKLLSTVYIYINHVYSDEKQALDKPRSSYLLNYTKHMLFHFAVLDFSLTNCIHNVTSSIKHKLSVSGEVRILNFDWHIYRRSFRTKILTYVGSLLH